jgi:hypothetical protein
MLSYFDRVLAGGLMDEGQDTEQGLTPEYYLVSPRKGVKEADSGD